MARNPELINKVTQTDNHDIEIDNVPDFDIADYDLDNTKEYKKYITRIERICRSSFEYKRFMNFLRDNAGFDRCSIMENVSNAEDRGIKIHIHHHPLTLFDIVSTIVNKNIATGASTDENMVAKEVMYNHYILHVGLIPLSETVHELVHNQYLFIPNDKVLGYWKLFIEEYKKYIPLETLSNIEKSELTTKNYDYKESTKVLDTGFTYVKVNDNSYKASEKELFEKLKTTLDELKSKDDNK